MKSSATTASKMTAAAIRKSLATISLTIAQGKQSWEMTHIFKLNDAVLKTYIDRDSYDIQSHAVISVWNTQAQTWNIIYSIPYSQMATLKTTSYVMRAHEVSARNFMADEATLMEIAYQIIF